MGQHYAPESNEVTLAQDAKNRAARTLYQGFAIDVALAIVAALVVWLGDNPVMSAAALTTLAVSVGKSVLQAASAFLMRLKLDASKLPTPLPPETPGVPNDDEPDPPEGRPTEDTPTTEA